MPPALCVGRDPQSAPLTATDGDFTGISLFLDPILIRDGIFWNHGAPLGRAEVMLVVRAVLPFAPCLDPVAAAGRAIAFQVA